MYITDIHIIYTLRTLLLPSITWWQAKYEIPECFVKALFPVETGPGSIAHIAEFGQADQVSNQPIAEFANRALSWN